MNVLIRQAPVLMVHCVSTVYPYSRVCLELVNKVIDMTAINMYAAVRIA